MKRSLGSYLVAALLTVGVLAHTCRASDWCRPDWDNDGTVGVPDIFAFLSSWFAGPAGQGDYNNDGSIDVSDIFAFLSDWFSGCPSRLTVTPNNGGWGDVLTLTADPTALPQNTSLTDQYVQIGWVGRYYPILGSPSTVFQADWSDQAIPSGQPNVCGLLITPYAFLEGADPSFLDAMGTFRGQVYVRFLNGPTLTGDVEFAPRTNAVVWRAVHYPLGPFSLVPPVLAEEAQVIRTYAITQVADPYNVTPEQLRAATGSHYVLTVKFARNSVSTSAALPYIYVNIYVYDGDGNFVQSAYGPWRNYPLALDDSYSDPDFVIYRSSLLHPFLFCDVDLPGPVPYYPVYPVLAPSTGNVRVIVTPGR